MNITVYCSSRGEINPEYDRCAHEIGRWIGEHGHTLIYGGMDLGDMRIMAKACRVAGGKVVGVVPSPRRGQAWPGNFENLLPEDLNQRKDIMINLGERFVALPGGYGTLDEIMSTLALLMFTKASMEKRMMIVNIDGIYNPLLLQLNLMMERGTLDPSIFDRFVVVDSTEAALAELEQFCS